MTYNPNDELSPEAAAIWQETLAKKKAFEKEMSTDPVLFEEFRQVWLTTLEKLERDKDTTLVDADLKLSLILLNRIPDLVTVESARCHPEHNLEEKGKHKPLSITMAFRYPALKTLQMLVGSLVASCNTTVGKHMPMGHGVRLVTSMKRLPRAMDRGRDERVLYRRISLQVHFSHFPEVAIKQQVEFIRLLENTLVSVLLYLKVDITGLVELIADREMSTDRK
jgi:hypothetical protein